jgi:hypothetical protein
MGDDEFFIDIQAGSGTLFSIPQRGVEDLYSSHGGIPTTRKKGTVTKKNPLASGAAGSFSKLEARQ